MIKTRRWVITISIISLITGIFISRNLSVTASSSDGTTNRTVIIIDAGHGGEDGGAISCTGVLESHINLQIAQKLNHIMHLLGWKTCMIRKEDVSIYTEGTTLSQKKVSDLKERVRIVNSTPTAVLISIHQNHYVDNRYRGAQVFYAPSDGSKLLAERIQNNFLSTINSGSRRNIKPADGIYLMQHCTCAAVLVECGFLSHFEEETMLRDPDYQRNISAIIAVSISTYLKDRLLT